MTSPFVHLHFHTTYSLLEASVQIDDALSLAAENGMNSLAITDYGNLFGAVEFFFKAKKKGIKPIIGCEIYVAPGSRLNKEQARHAAPYHHLVLLAENQAGYRNLLKLISLAHVEGFYFKPRIDKPLLAENAEGLIGLSGTLRGEIPYLLERNQRENAMRAATEYRDILGKENFFIELWESGRPEQKKMNAELLEIANEAGLKPVATNDVHFLREDDARVIDILHCLAHGKTIDQLGDGARRHGQLYFKTGQEMEQLFKEVPEAISNTAVIADRCQVKMSSGETFLPQYSVPQGFSRDSYLADLARRGLEERLERIAEEKRDFYRKRLEEELAMLVKMGYAGYFLIVWDIINYARTHQIPVGPGRGSAAGSLVAYSLKITDIDPIAYGLIFERFLNPERVSLPDIDMDFCMERREEVIRYVVNKYGSDHVAQIITFGTMAAKGAIRDVGRVLDIPYAEVDRVAKLVPNELNITLEKALAQEPKISEAMNADPRISEMMTRARSIEGLARHASTHAAGIVISDKPLIEHVPLYRGAHDEIVTQFQMGDIEKIGLVKFDFLGLRTLTVIQKAEDIIRNRTPFDISSVPMNDRETYALLCRGETLGVFQLESRGMVDLLMKMEPERFEDLIALLALYRPGPIGSGMLDDFIKRKRGKTRIVYEHPLLEDILKETYGIIVYQEQVMKIANVLAGFSLGGADLLRRAMGKKLPEEMEKQKEIFLEGSKKNKIPEKKAEKIFDLMAYFAGYGFNKSHSAAYALITYQTAFLKAHYPAEFMVALLSSDMGNPDKIVHYLSECRRMKLKIFPPDVNASENDFTIEGEGIRFGLGAVRNVGTAAIESILSVRKEGGPFKSLFQFCRRVDLRKVNKRVLEGLIKGGALAVLPGHRSSQMAALESAIDLGNLYQKEQEAGQENLFGGFRKESCAEEDPLAELSEWDEQTLLKNEKESLGFYLSSHPLSRFEKEIRKYYLADSSALDEKEDGAEVRMAGLISSKKVTRTKKGDPMAYLRIEDLSGTVEGIVFPELYRSSSRLLESDQPLIFSGTIDKGEKGIKLKLTRLEVLQEIPRQHLKVEISLNSELHSEEDIATLRDLLVKYPGSAAVHIRLSAPAQKEYTIAAGDRFSFAPQGEAMEELERLFGKQNIIVTGM